MRPLTIVISVAIEGISLSGAVMGSLRKTVRSAANPGAIFPRDFSSKAAHAASDVKRASASRRVSFSELRHPPAGSPRRSCLVIAA